MQGECGVIYPLNLAKRIASRYDAVAQNNLGLMFYQGHGVAQDKAEAIRWFRLAAAQGDTGAAAWLERLGT